MPLPQDTCRLFWVATTLRVKQVLRNHATANDVPRIRLNEPSDTSDANVAAARSLLQLRVLRFGFLQDGDVGIGVCPEGAENRIPIRPTSQFGFAGSWLKFSISHTSDASAATLTMICRPSGLTLALS
jgi:hypothetical protein